MKKITKLFPITLGLLASLIVVLSSCDKMNDMQEEYASREETVYLGKVDSIKYYSGFRRAKITWYVGSDPKIDRTIIYWNMRQDSIVKEFVRTTPGVQKDSIILDNMPEGSTLFEFRNVNNQGQTSLYSTATVTVWGSEYADGLRARRLQAFDYDFEQSIYNLTLSPTTEGDNVVYSQVVYTNTFGQERTVKVERDDSEISLPGFPDGGSFAFRTVFFPPQGIDTVYNDFASYSAPTVINDSGRQIDLPGDVTSKYFERDGKFLYEWNTSGDIIIYNVAADGLLSETVSFSGIVPKTTYRDFFFYDDDKFIGITTGNAVSMHQIENNELITVRNAAGAATFGAGFTFEMFLPTRGYFYSRTAGSVATGKGEIKTWVAKNDASWGTPNGTTVGAGYHVYNPFVLFNHQALLGVDEEGYLWSMPVSVSGTIGSKSRIGKGWNRYSKIFSVGTTLYAMNSDGALYVFSNFATTGKYWVVN